MTQTMHPGKARRAELVQTRGVTLDGRPAMIVGASEPYAHVYVKGSALSVEFSWSAAEHVVSNRGGRFKS